MGFVVFEGGDLEGLGKVDQAVAVLDRNAEFAAGGEDLEVAGAGEGAALGLGLLCFYVL